LTEHDYSWDDQDPDQITDLVMGQYNSSPDIEDWTGGLGEEDKSDESNKQTLQISTGEDTTSDTVLTKDETERLALAVDGILGTMHPREAGVIRARFGFGDTRQKIKEEISVEFGVTLERISQIESKFLSKLKAAHQRGTFKEFLEPN
jgi:DNA-directed RNA polymerase sigma subunit (sigma70/sigma32)